MAIYLTPPTTTCSIWGWKIIRDQSWNWNDGLPPRSSVESTSASCVGRMGLFVPAVVLERLGRLPGAASSAVAAWHTPRCCQRRTHRLLSRRVHLPLQPSHIEITWEIVLSIASTSSPDRSGDLSKHGQFPHRSMKPQHIVAGGAKWIAITIVHRVT